MSLLDVTNLCFNYDGTKLLENVNFRLFSGDHLGLVGLNGTGKSTFMKILCGELKQDKGEVCWLKNIKIGYMDQFVSVDNSLTCEEYLKSVYKDMYDKEKLMEEYFVKSGENEKFLTKACNLQDYLIDNDFYKIKSKIGSIVDGLGFDSSYLHKTLKTLSGGEKEKIILAKLLLEEVDVLLLDEPTNFLDVNQIKWLANYLNNYDKAFIVISHDVSFLGDICNVVAELKGNVITRYKGDYNNYLSASKLREEQTLSAYNNQQKYIKKTQELIDKNIVRATTSKMAKSRRKALEKLEIIEKPVGSKKVYFNFIESGDCGDLIFELKDYLIGYNKPLTKPLNMEFRKNNKYLILGDNGVGKTTLIKSILGIIPSLGGYIKRNERIKIAYFKQIEDIRGVSPFNYLKNKYSSFEDKKIKQILGSVGLDRKLFDADMATLSGGEQTKVRIAYLMLTSSNVLIMDEPTNHLDKDARSALIKALKKYSKTVILISHDDFYEELENVIKIDYKCL